MGERLAVRWSEDASRDLEDIVSFIAVDDADAAERLLERLLDAASSLRELPDRGRVVPELASAGVLVYRELIVRPYRVLYRRHGADEVRVHAVLDGRRSLEDVLFERLLRS